MWHRELHKTVLIPFSRHQTSLRVSRTGPDRCFLKDYIYPSICSAPISLPGSPSHQFCPLSSLPESLMGFCCCCCLLLLFFPSCTISVLKLKSFWFLGKSLRTVSTAVDLDVCLIFLSCHSHEEFHRGGINPHFLHHFSPIKTGQTPPRKP